MTAQPSTLPQLHTLADVARKYGLSLRMLQIRARARKFDHIHIGSKRYLTDDMVSDLLAKSTVTASAPSDQREADLAATRERVTKRRSRQRPAA